jgi:hypothetical protein
MYIFIQEDKMDFGFFGELSIQAFLVIIGAVSGAFMTFVIAYYGWEDSWKVRGSGRTNYAQKRAEERHNRVEAARAIISPGAHEVQLVARAAFVLEYVVGALFYFVPATAIAVLTYLLYLVAANTSERRDQGIELVIYILAGFSALSYLGALRQVWQAKSFLHDVYNFEEYDKEYQAKWGTSGNAQSPVGP